jgi:hypothetical protein
MASACVGVPRRWGPRQGSVKIVDSAFSHAFPETMDRRLVHSHRSTVLAVSAGLPLVACAAVAPFRDSVENTNAALLLVLVVVAAASTGIRSAGMVAAVSSAMWFDFLLTAPFNRLTINDRADIETTVLLVLVGIAVTELSLWGRRQQDQASRQHGYLAGVISTVGTVAVGGSDLRDLTEDVAMRLREVLNIDACHFESTLTPTALARLIHDGRVTRVGRYVDVDRYGLPTDTEVELLVQAAGVVRGRYLLTAATRISRPNFEQRRVAIALADQVGAALALERD